VSLYPFLKIFGEFSGLCMETKDMGYPSGLGAIGKKFSTAAICNSKNTQSAQSEIRNCTQP